MYFVWFYWAVFMHMTGESGGESMGCGGVGPSDLAVGRDGRGPRACAHGYSKAPRCGSEHTAFLKSPEEWAHPDVVEIAFGVVIPRSDRA